MTALLFQLPVEIDVIKHPNELDGKSTAVHAAILAPEDVKIYTYPVIPDYPDPNKVYLVEISVKGLLIT